MNGKWSLNSLYKGFDAPEFKSDFEAYKDLIARAGAYAKTEFNAAADARAKLIGYLKLYIDTMSLAEKLCAFAQLTLSADVNDETAAKTLDILEEETAKLAAPQALFFEFVAKNGDNLGEIIKQSPLLEEHAFALNEALQKSKYVLSDREETVIAAMETTGSSAWEKLRDNLTATLMIEITVNGETKKEPLSVIRNYAHSAEAAVRKAAYEAELAAYPSIEKSVAACLNGIKGEALTVSKMRGYASPLEMTLINSRMDQETLDSLINAIKRRLPDFRLFLRHKAKLLGHTGALPFYDLFAPLGKSDTYTFGEAKHIVQNTFAAFSPKLASLAEQAFSENWIDIYPRDGKTGGAFCASVHPLSESRILLNFPATGGAFSDITTLAHELGHAYHNACLRGQSIINAYYTMPIAETASTFCETLVTEEALKGAGRDMALMARNEALTGAAQVIVDIYSRFLFERRVFEARKNGSLSVAELNALMTGAQTEAYGDGLDPGALHGYAWIPKTHYYNAHYNFYNFPYAYGFLFSKGLYALYIKEGEGFVPKYEELLAVTGRADLREAGQKAGIDVRSEAFWDGALDTVRTEIDMFCEL